MNISHSSTCSVLEDGSGCDCRTIPSYATLYKEIECTPYCCKYSDIPIDDATCKDLSISNVSRDLISARRESVLQAYNSASAENHLRFLEGDDKATAEYIFPNQIEDANNIVDKFYKHKRRVISIQKKTKVGADGLMIEIAKLLTTHIDDKFVVNPANVRIITGMSNAGWEKDMIDKAPNCFKDKIFHHGKLSRSDLTNLRNGLIIIDEIDTGDKEYQVLHNTLKEAGVLDVKRMQEDNNRFVFISATMIKELYDLYRWGELHELYKMTIPTSYIGHKNFLDKKIVKEFYALNTKENAEKWVQEDILNHYGTDYRVHLVRVNAKIVDVVQNACIRKGVAFRNHTSTDRLSEEEIKEFFKESLDQHIVLGVKGFFRRANLIPNRWKLRIGATHELYTKKVDNNVQIQGLTGRMTGYWRDVIEGGHKTGPHRTSVKAIEEYETTYNDPFGTNSYHTAGFNKKKGKVIADPTMLSAKHIENLEAVDLPVVNQPPDPKTIPVVVKVTSEEYAKFKKISRKWDEKGIFDIIRKYNPDVVNTIVVNNLHQIQITESKDNNDTYKKRIIDFVKAHDENRTYTLGTGGVHKDSYQIFLDSIEHRVVISIYYGSKHIV